VRPGEFKNPGTEFSEVPLWFWNDKLTNHELLRQLDEINQAGWKSFYIVAAPGLVTPYLSAKWMEKVRLVVQAASERGMHAWLYDENIYPSGYAEGIVPALNPDFRLKALVMRLAARPDKVHEAVAVFECELQHGEVADPVQIEPGGEARPEKAYLEFCQYQAAIGDANQAGITTVDVLNPNAADAFIECTHAKYANWVGEWFGATVPGIFTDEPQYRTGRRCNLPALPWTERLPEHFRSMHGYDLIGHLPCLFFPLGKYKKVRIDFYECVTDLFIQSWSKRVYDWCDRHGLKLTGHVMDEDTLASQIDSVGSCMPHYEYMHVPGLDQLGTEGPPWLQGDRGIATLLTAKQPSSVAAQLGRSRVFCEWCAVSSQNLSFQDRKWIGDWLAVLGVNLFAPSSLWYSLRGNRKRFPPVLFFQQPWWGHSGLLAGYFHRLSYALSQGKPWRDVVVLHPMRSAWAAYSPLNKQGCDQINDCLDWLQRALLGAHHDYDLADETLMARHARVEGKTFVMGECRYRLVILPVATTWAEHTVRLLSQFVSNGGTVVALEPVASTIEGEPFSELTALMEKVHHVDEQHLVDVLAAEMGPEKNIEITGNGAELIWYQLRMDDDQAILFLANTDRDKTVEVKVSIRLEGGCEEWNLLSGETRGIPSVGEGGRQAMQLSFPPAGSHLLVVDASKQPTAPNIVKAGSHSRIELGDTWQLSRHDPNALNLDYCRYKIGEGPWSGIVPVHVARDKVRTAGYGTPYALRYEFTSSLPTGNSGQLLLVTESPEEHRLTVNGRPIYYQDGGYWIDPTFKTIDIRPLVNKGQNQIEIQGKAGLDMPTTPSWAGTWGPEVEDCYVIGDLAVQASANGFELVQETGRVRTGDLVSQGYPFYVGAMSLTQQVHVADAGRRSFLELEGLQAIVAEVWVNDELAGAISLKPYRVEVTGHLTNGENVVRVKLISSLRNLLGPLHHVKGELGWVYPESYLPVGAWFGAGQLQWTDRYNFVPLGFAGAGLVIEQ